ncbi:hypothetical protein N7471_013903 [Penicillium samsonianum]|uniref:uncharacterized protein n=1 Tax=Penicillium samsonianum TaxID=1882272 RepID=UPI002547C6C4|nr:uncharacterized protein N7471_013903 [Penicillium samsonianum]KAJ6118436.1 hypothetical protein N7471_013903 [Penicillium samsonianum]
MSGFQPVHYVPASRQAQILAMPVKRILAVPHRKAGGTNHWCLYLSSSPTSSVRIDCQPSHTVPSSVLRGGSKANLIISELPYETSTDAQAQFILDVAPGLSVGQVWGKLLDMGVINTNLMHLELGADAGLLIRLIFYTNFNLSVAAAKAGILKLWPDQTPLPLDQGAYYQ